VTSGPQWLLLPDARPFYEALCDFGDAGHWQPEHMLALFAAESDLTPLARNKYQYQGLSQLGEKELRNLGWRPESMGDFCAARPEVQVQYTAAYYAEWRRQHRIPEWTSPGHLMAANLAPAHLARADQVVYSRKEHPKQYRANEICDRNGDGVIDWQDCSDYVTWVVNARCPARFQLALTGLNQVRALRLAGDALDAARALTRTG